MAGLQEIPVRVENTSLADGLTQNVAPILHEIRHALQGLCGGGEPTIIDLSAMPFGPGDEDQLVAALGAGEVTATINAIGTSTVRETAYSGVWVVEHLGPDGARITLHIEVADVPFLLKTPREDMNGALQRLARHLEETSLGPLAEPLGT